MAILTAHQFGNVGFLQIWKVTKIAFYKQGLIIQVYFHTEIVLWVFRTTIVVPRFQYCARGKQSDFFPLWDKGFLA